MSAGSYMTWTHKCSSNWSLINQPQSHVGSNLQLCSDFYQRTVFCACVQQLMCTVNDFILLVLAPACVVMLRRQSSGCCSGCWIAPPQLFLSLFPTIQLQRKHEHCSFTRPLHKQRHSAVRGGGGHHFHVWVTARSTDLDFYTLGQQID